MASSTLVPTLVILDRPSDWDEWCFLVEQKAHASGIWHLIDPDLPEEPAQPTRPTEPKASDIKRAAGSVIDLDQDEQNTYRLLWATYKSQLSDYKETQRGIQQLQSYILSSISRTNITFIIGQTTLYNKLTALKKRLAPTDRARKHLLRQEYQKLKKPPKDQETEQWLQQWEKIYADIQKLGLPDVQADLLLYNFLLIIKPLNRTFART
jgi:hypothetical protein